MSLRSPYGLRRVVFCAVGVISLYGISIPRASAWNGTGHMVIADIAFDHLTPAVRAKVDALLTKQPAYRMWMSEMPAGDTDKARFAFMKAATWPDDIRGTPASRPTWHYIDLPVIAPGYNVDPATIAPPTPNAETQIAVEKAMLTQSGASDRDRAVALCWVEHLIGDIHQPLHAATLYSSIFPHGDKGGNAEQLADGAVANDPVEESANPSRLHAIWDDALGDDHNPADILAMAHDLETSSYARRTFPQLTQHTTVHSWALESNALAKAVAYAGGTLPMTTRLGHAGDPPSVTVTLPPGYLSTVHAFSNRQIALAGLRLADTLNTMFSR